MNELVNLCRRVDELIIDAFFHAFRLDFILFSILAHGTNRSPSDLRSNNLTGELSNVNPIDASSKLALKLAA